MRGKNKVILIGTLGKDPESKTFPNGGSLCQISIATSESWTDKNSGEKKESTEWHRIVLQNRLGEIAQQYLRKGSRVYIEGKLRTRQWTDQNSNTQYTTEIIANDLQLLDKSEGNQNGQGNNQNQGGYGQRGNQQGNNQNQGGYGQGQQGQNGWQSQGQSNNNQNSNGKHRQNNQNNQNGNNGGNLDNDTPFSRLDSRLA